MASTPQTGEVTWAPLVEPEEWEIDWTQTAVDIDRLIRAALPDPGAYTGIGDELLVILNARPTDSGIFDSLPPGTPYVHGGYLNIRCGQGALSLRRVRLGRRHLSGAELARLFV